MESETETIGSMSPSPSTQEARTEYEHYMDEDILVLKEMERNRYLFAYAAYLPDCYSQHLETPTWNPRIFSGYAFSHILKIAREEEDMERTNQCIIPPSESLLAYLDEIAQKIGIPRNVILHNIATYGQHDTIAYSIIEIYIKNRNWHSLALQIQRDLQNLDRLLPFNMYCPLRQAILICARIYFETIEVDANSVMYFEVAKEKSDDVRRAIMQRVQEQAAADAATTQPVDLTSNTENGEAESETMFYPMQVLVKVAAIAQAIEEAEPAQRAGIHSSEDERGADSTSIDEAIRSGWRERSAC
ncbi:hypothetical protein B7494_g2928 [Chlorociboria aeruginascens]|nr:hypothetical protein B7494_g2928 [Chlorociboria aeruginascens]